MNAGKSVIKPLKREGEEEEDRGEGVGGRRWGEEGGGGREGWEGGEEKEGKGGRGGKREVSNIHTIPSQLWIVSV